MLERTDSASGDFAIDVVIQYFDEPLGDGLSRRIQHASREELESFASIYAGWSDSVSTLKRTRADELRPFIPRLAHWWLTDPDYARYGMAGVSTTQLARVSPLLKSVLLYSHSVALDNPLSSDVKFTAASSRLTVDQVDDFRACLLSFVAFSTVVDDLVRNGVLIWLEPRRYERYAATRVGGGSYGLEVPPATEAPFELAYITPLAVRQSVEGCLVHGYDALDVFCPNRLGVAVLDHAVKADRRLASPQGSEAETRPVSALLEVPLPAVGDLPFSEIVALRRDAESFARFRDQIRAAMDTATSLAREGASPEAQARAARELFASSALAVQRELTATWRSRIWDALARAGVGALVGEAAHIGAGLDSEASPARLTTNVVGDLLLRSASGRAHRRTSNTLAAHYAVFSPPDT